MLFLNYMKNFYSSLKTYLKDNCLFIYAIKMTNHSYFLAIK